jgi:hypothetical protein
MTDPPLSPVPPPPPEEVATAARRGLASLADAARTITGAEVCAVMALRGGDLVIEALSGKGNAVPPGEIFPAHASIAGWTLASGEPIVVKRIDGRPDIVEDVCTLVGYVPSAVSAAPIIRGESQLGVIEILDGRAGHSLGDFVLLTTFADQAGVLLDELRRVTPAGTSDEPDETEVTEILAGLRSADGVRGETARHLLAMLRDVLSDETGDDQAG